MKRTMFVLVLSGAALALSACCGGKTRFWSGQDAAGNTVYSVDTEDDPLGQTAPAEYLDGSGRRVAAHSPRMQPISEEQYVQGTNGGSYAVHYCPKQGCWAEPVPAR